jgi:hypothetical protein
MLTTGHESTVDGQRAVDDHDSAYLQEQPGEAIAGAPPDPSADGCIHAGQQTHGIQHCNTSVALDAYINTQLPKGIPAHLQVILLFSFRGA